MIGRLLLASICLWAQDAPYGNQLPSPKQELSGPSWRTERDEWQTVQNADYASWLAKMRQWRKDYLASIDYNGAEYDRSEFAWTRRNIVHTQMMVEDRYFYDPVQRRYTVDRYLDDLIRRYGGIDSVLVWPVYPNIGVDNRNQFDMVRDLPGGISGVRQMVRDFQRRGVKVFFPVMPWDKGTRDEGVSNAEAAARLMKEIGADGVNGDTMSGVPRDFRVASDSAAHPLVFEPEQPSRDDRYLMWNHHSWGYWTYPFLPTVSKHKWLEPRHVVHVCNRWARDHNDDLQYAFFNGVGFVAWENVWGIWTGITPRDGEALRRIAAIFREHADLLVSADWQPYVPTSQFGVFASRFPSSSSTLWTVVNRNEYSVSGEQLRVAHTAGRRYFDLWNGAELTPVVHDGQAALTFGMEARGFGAVLSVEAQGRPPALTRGPVLSSFSREWKALPQRMVEIPRTKAPLGEPDGMVAIPGGEFDFAVTGTAIEGFNWSGLDVQYPWEDSPRRFHRQRLSIEPFFIDKHPVTSAEYRAFVLKTGYKPGDDHNFLRDSQGPNQPVVWVSIEDARAYCAAFGKRLPHEWEWQYAAQGSGKVVPTPHTGRDLPGPPEVGRHPGGASRFGVEDLIGTVWHWTDEYVDEHTRAAVLRGGSYYRPRGAEWYFPEGTRLDTHNKYLLMAPGKDRAGTIGFRCVVDAR